MNSWLHESDAAKQGVTQIVALNRIGAAADIADAVGFFASDDSRWITGETVDVNGGLWLGQRSVSRKGSNG
jgi:NAD(P)-dependent dehydrogenase (short-subunit alcohol dehydrogenase family)